MRQSIETTGRRTSRSPDSAQVPASAGLSQAWGGAGTLLALLLLSAFAWAPLLYPGYLQVHSGFLPLFNLADLANSGDGLRWLPRVGLNTDLLRGDGPLAYWLALVVRPWLGDQDAIKLLLGLSVVAGGFGTFAWIRHTMAESTGRSGQLAGRAGLLAAMIYMLWPPLLAALYVRGALGQVAFMGFLPWALFFSGSSRNQAQLSALARAARPLLGALAVASLFLTQPGLALWSLPLLAAWTLSSAKAWPTRLASLTGLPLGVLLAGGLLWGLHGSSLLSGGAAVTGGAFADHAVYPFQLFSPGWGFGVSTPGWQDQLPLQLGLAAVGLAFLAIALVPGTGGTTSRRPMARGWALAALLAYVLLATTLARPLWEHLPALSRPLSYPWQLIALAGPPLTLLGSAVLLADRRLGALPVWSALVALVVLSSYPYLAPRFTQLQPGSQPVATLGENQIMLLAAQVDWPVAGPAIDADQPALQAAQTLTVTLSWQALAPVDFDYNVFVHAVDEAGATLVQWDGQPQREDLPYPPTAWQVGEIVTGLYPLQVDTAKVSRIQRIDLGLYDWQTGERLATEAGNQVELELAP